MTLSRASACSAENCAGRCPRYCVAAGIIWAARLLDVVVVLVLRLVVEAAGRDRRPRATSSSVSPQSSTNSRRRTVVLRVCNLSTGFKD